MRYKVNPAEVFRRCEAYMLFYVRLKPRQQPPVVPKSRVVPSSGRKRPGLAFNACATAANGSDLEADPDSLPLSKRFKFNQQQQPLQHPQPQQQPQQADDLKQHIAGLLRGNSSGLRSTTLGTGLAVQQAQKQAPAPSQNDPSCSNGGSHHMGSPNALRTHTNGATHVVGACNGATAVRSVDSSSLSNHPISANGYHNHTTQQSATDGGLAAGPDLDQSPRQAGRASASPTGLPGWLTGADRDANTSKVSKTNGIGRHRRFGFPGFSFKGHGHPDTATHGSLDSPGMAASEATPPAATSLSKLGEAVAGTPPPSVGLGMLMASEEPRLVRRKLNSSPAFDSDGQLASLPTASHHRMDSMQRVSPDAEHADATKAVSAGAQSPPGVLSAQQTPTKLGAPGTSRHSNSQGSPEKETQQKGVNAFSLPGSQHQPKRLASIYQPSAAPPDTPLKPTQFVPDVGARQPHADQQDRVSFRLAPAHKGQSTAGQVSREHFPMSFGSKSNKSGGRAWHTVAQLDLPDSSAISKTAPSALGTQVASAPCALPSKQSLTVPEGGQAADQDPAQQASDALTAGKPTAAADQAMSQPVPAAKKRKGGILKQMHATVM